MKQTLLYANNARSTTLSGITTSSTTIAVADLSKFPTIVTGDQAFKVTMDDGAGHIEIVLVRGTASGSFLNCLRGQEGTTAFAFPSGTPIEMRLTAGSISQFARLQDRMYGLASIDALESPANSDGNSYVCSSTDPDGGPILAVRLNDSKWRLAQYPHVVMTGLIGAGATLNSVVATGASSAITNLESANYIVQFTSGVNAGRMRFVSGATTTGFSWATALPDALGSTDAFEIYRYAMYSASIPAGSNGDKIFFPNSKIITAAYTIPTDKNVMSAGPISIASGVVQVVPAGCSWSIV